MCAVVCVKREVYDRFFPFLCFSLRHSKNLTLNTYCNTEERMPLFTSKVTPANEKLELEQEDEDENWREISGEIFVISLHTLFLMFGGQRHPKLLSFEALMDKGALHEYLYLKPHSKIIHISHEWVGTDHPDPQGDQFYHLLLLLERLQRGDVGPFRV